PLFSQTVCSSSILKNLQWGSSFLTKEIPAAQQKSMYHVGILKLNGPGFQYPFYNNALAKFHQDILRKQLF
uniref:Uncharacterized protein n=1 Tax=Zosterops lateralis melanops TaxID=1220523 RepID=A0A8D2PJ03_ZOSLA